MTELGQLLLWDSAFFGRRIGRITPGRLDAATLAAALRWADDEHIETLYMLADADDAATVELLESASFGLKDLRVTLARSPTPLPPAPSLPAGARIDHAQPEDLPALAALARVSHTDTRFFYDRRFPPEAAAELYALWLQRRGAGPTLTLALRYDDEPAGYITGTVADDTGQISLIALSAALRGQGLGQALVHAALVWFAEQGASRCTVVTQGRNIPAQRLYQRAGFRTSAVQLWYHRWFERG